MIYITTKFRLFCRSNVLRECEVWQSVTLNIVGLKNENNLIEMLTLAVVEDNYNYCSRLINW